eukprot:9718742-Alexandrium_andersonii.AAC.1
MVGGLVGRSGPTSRLARAPCVALPTLFSLQQHTPLPLGPRRADRCLHAFAGAGTCLLYTSPSPRD